MKHDYTANILKNIYKELSLTDRLETQYAIQADEEWKSEFNLLKSAYRLLPKVSFFPKQSIIRNLIAYSARTAA